MKFNWSFNHLGMMVTDRDEVLEYYQSIFKYILIDELSALHSGVKASQGSFS